MIFFFFKQKTAYEMRISDWSSDVCSSDLSYTDCLTEDDLLVISLAITEFCAAKEAARNNGMPIDPLVVSPRSGRIQRSAHSLAAEIGRASCRERVCQYV